LVVDGLPTSACMHAPEYNVVEVPGFARCGQLQARDSLDAFNWHCDDSTGRARMVSVGLKSRRRLGDLIDWRRRTWRDNSVTVEHRNVRLLTTEPNTWWRPEQLRALPPLRQQLDGGRRIVLDEPGIYLAGTDTLPDGIDQIEVAADHVTLLTAPHRQLRGLGKSASLQVQGRNFTWLEGSFANLGLQYTGARYAVLRHVVSDREGVTGKSLAIDIRQGERIDLRHLEIVAQPEQTADAYGLGLDMSQSQLRDVAFLGAYAPFIVLSGSSNRLSDVWVPDPRAFNFYSDGASVNNVVVNLGQ
jgi:hypothetical protein